MSGHEKILEGEITVLREELGTLVAELDRRRHDALDVKGQLKRHSVEVGLTALALVAAASGFVWVGVWRARRRQRLTYQGSQLREAVSRMIARPERVAAEPTVPAKILTAAANALIASLIRKVLERLLRPAPGTSHRRALDRHADADDRLAA